MEYLLHTDDGRLDFPVYPGHPITLAVQIARAFPSLDAAHGRTEHGWPAALSSGLVSGAGGSVYMALQALDKLRSGESLDTVLSWSDACCYERPYRDKWPAACEQARRYLASTDLMGWVHKPHPRQAGTAKPVSIPTRSRH
jgi:hypothetical protein